MCEAASIIAAVGVGVAVYGQVSGADAQAKAAERQARYAEAAGIDAVQRGEKEAGLARMAGSALIGKQKVAAAVSGVEATEGTPMKLMADTRLLSELDAQTIRNNAFREAWGYKMGAGEELERGRQARAQGQVNAAGTLLGGAAQIASYQRGR